MLRFFPSPGREHLRRREIFSILEKADDSSAKYPERDAAEEQLPPRAGRNPR